MIKHKPKPDTCPDQPCFRCSQPFYFTFCLFTFISPCSSSPAYSISLQCPTNPHIHNLGPLGLHPCKVLVFLQVCLQVLYNPSVSRPDKVCSYLCVPYFPLSRLCFCIFYLLLPPFLLLFSVGNRSFASYT